LVATEKYLRLYPVASATRGARGAARRVELPGPLRFAGAFAAGGAPALACLLRREGGDDSLNVRRRPESAPGAVACVLVCRQQVCP
jgi:hypothetical protein